MVEVIDCKAKIYMPNIFSPNEDGFNDSFMPVGKNFEPISLHIFDRWGDRIYETNAPDFQPWNGLSIKNEPIQKGVYVYLFTYLETLTGLTQTAEGELVLVR